MTTVDNLLLKIVNFTDPSIESQLTSRDSKVLRNLASSIVDKIFITENQSKLLIKILKENSKKLSKFSEDIENVLLNPTWSRNFREIVQIHKLYLGKNQEDEIVIVIESTFNSEIRQILNGLMKKGDNVLATPHTKRYTADLTEKNIELLVETLSPYNFDIDEKIKSHYEIIKTWKREDFVNQFKLTTITNSNFQKCITDDLGLTTNIDQNIINDRSIRYQYFVDTPKNPGENLTEYIANRPATKVWVDKNQHSLSEIISSLIQLKRLPILVVFDTLINNKYLENLRILSESLEQNKIEDHVGVYFRLPNDEHGKKFNQFIAEKKYNYLLDNTTKIACVQSGKLPKFFLKNAWRPMSVIALDSRMGMRHGKTAVYSNNCDCILEWSDEPPLDDKRIKS